MYFITRKKFESLNGGKIQLGDLVYCLRGATFGKTAIVDPYAEGSIASSLMIIRPFAPISNRYMYQYLICPVGRSQIFRFDNGSAQPNLSANSVRLYVYPLPPLPEQHRIVARIDQLMARCDELERLRKVRGEKRLAVHAAAIKQLLDASSSPPRRRGSSHSDSLDSRLRGNDVSGGGNDVSGRGGDGASVSAWDFIQEHFGELYTVKENVVELRKAILQLAVMGRLVPQNTNDPPASELLKEIEVEKQRFHSSSSPRRRGSSKPTKSLPPIKPEEVPYALPRGWEWVRFFEPNTVKSELVSARDYPDENQIAPDSIEKDTGRLLFHRTVAESGAIGPNNRFYEGQILYSKIRPSLNKVVVAPYDGLCSADMYPIVCHAHTAYMLKAILSEPFLAQVRLAENRVKMPKLNLESLGLLLIPLPPLPEQHRIVARIDQLMALCDTLEQQIEAATHKQTKLLYAVMAGMNQGGRGGLHGHGLQERACPS